MSRALVQTAIILRSLSTRLVKQSSIHRKCPTVPALTPNKALERTVGYRGPHPGCQQVVGWLCMRQAAAWSAAQRDRYTACPRGYGKRFPTTSSPGFAQGGPVACGGHHWVRCVILLGRGGI